jgi:hypothetical protein
MRTDPQIPGCRSRCLITGMTYSRVPIMAAG